MRKRYAAKPPSTGAGASSAGATAGADVGALTPDGAACAAAGAGAGAADVTGTDTFAAGAGVTGAATAAPAAGNTTIPDAVADPAATGVIRRVGGTVCTTTVPLVPFRRFV